VELEMMAYLGAFVTAGVILPILLHVSSPELMPWWPDTVSMGIAFGAAAFAIVWKERKDGESRRRLWRAMKTIGCRWTSK
jgi:hypothetical protein